MPTTSPPHSRRTPRPAPRPSYRAARAFYLTLFIATCFAAFAFLSSHNAVDSAHAGLHLLTPRSKHHHSDPDSDLSADERCRLVRHARDQCAFVHKHCPVDEPGFSTHLDLFYCRLAHAKVFGFVLLVSWLGLLFSTIGIAASDFFCINLSTLAQIMGMSESMAGVTFLAFGNGSPDVFSTFAAMNTNSGSLAVGELFGAACFITAVVAGSMALIRPFQVAKKSFIRDVGFFTVAAAFSMTFLWDGRLHFWECIVMVLYYFFYVGFVVAWHWWIGKRRKRREAETAARGHYVAAGDELDVEDEYDDDDADESSRPRVSRGASVDDWSALERGGPHFADGANEDEEEEARDRWMSELNSNMRLTRPKRSRVNTMMPVRPSLVGALEFQVVLKQLQKSRNIQTYPMNVRRYSDDPTFTTLQQQDQLSTSSDIASRPPLRVTTPDGEATGIEQASLDVPRSAPPRTRAVSANDAQSLQISSDLMLSSRSSTPGHARGASLTVPGNDGLQPSQQRPSLELPGSTARGFQPPSPNFEVSLASPRVHEGMPLLASAGHHERSKSADRLAPPSRGSSPGSMRSRRLSDLASPVPEAKSLPRIIIPGRGRSQTSSTTTSPFPCFQDDVSPSSSRTPSINLPPPSRDSVTPSQSAELEAPRRPTFLTRWWPHSVLPPPELIVSTLFPTIYHWSEKNLMEKALGVVAAPSVFLLTVTLPVVESGRDDEDEDEDDDLDTAPVTGPGRPNIEVHDEYHPGSHSHGSTPHNSLGTGVANVATATEQVYRNNAGSNPAKPSTPILENPPSPPWNRWLLIIQLFLAPLFGIYAVYSQIWPDTPARAFVKPVLISLLLSAVTLVLFLRFTTATHRPAGYRLVLAIAGFFVSIAWISLVADQVVGALKALAVILNMSHAIMGLTIFAVGNSLGDLVADVTVARLGYPVMALSACFGGPMLNILLGIGLSGSWILFQGAQKRMHRHPEDGGDWKFKSYHIEVSSTLLVSGATLMLTLVGLLIVVPLNRWVLSRTVGWCLIGVWVVSTAGNVAVEVSGLGRET